MYLNFETVSFLWLILLALLVWRAWFVPSSPVAGLGVCHWLSQAINHFIAEFFIRLSGEETEARSNAELGYEITGWAVMGLITALLGVSLIYRPRGVNQVKIDNLAAARNVGYVGIAFGLVTFFFLSSALSFIPSITAIVSGGLAMAAASLAWLYLMKLRFQGPVAGLATAAIAFSMPAMTLVFMGFMGYGIGAIFGVGAVVFATFKPRWVILLGFPVLLFFGLSLYPSYMLARGDIRGSVWGGADLDKRIETTVNSLSDNWQWFDPTDGKQMEMMNGRLNQNVLVGAAYIYIEGGSSNYAYGETLLDGLLALIPRAIWPDKPISAGSFGLVTRFTGIRFEAGTSVGIGNLMELFVNGGIPLVFFGYFFIGCALYWMDARAGLAIQQLDYRNFLLWYVPGQSLMNAIGSFVEWGPSFVGAFVLVSVFLFYYDRFYGVAKE